MYIINIKCSRIVSCAQKLYRIETYSSQLKIETFQGHIIKLLFQSVNYDIHYTCMVTCAYMRKHKAVRIIYTFIAKQNGVGIHSREG